MKRTFAVASRRACLRVVLIAWPPRLLVPRRPSSRPHPYLNHPLTRAPPFRQAAPLPLLTSRALRVSQLAAISHSSTNWITLSCERPMVTAANTRAARWRLLLKGGRRMSLRRGIFYEDTSFRCPCFREENLVPFLGRKSFPTVWDDIFWRFLFGESVRGIYIYIDFSEK